MVLTLNKLTSITNRYAAFARRNKPCRVRSFTPTTNEFARVNFGRCSLLDNTTGDAVEELTIANA